MKSKKILAAVDKAELLSIAGDAHKTYLEWKARAEDPNEPEPSECWKAAKACARIELLCREIAKW